MSDKTLTRTEAAQLAQELTNYGQAILDAQLDIAKDRYEHERRNYLDKAKQALMYLRRLAQVDVCYRHHCPAQLRVSEIDSNAINVALDGIEMDHQTALSEARFDCWRAMETNPDAILADPTLGADFDLAA